ncbi:hypothetical protein ACFYKX_11570 [Cytobacillus sp. FJAT-54145]|uniref:Uncharacterized protein n=1 Tax=Cytobacillus spartinae TaxID=3299023 RepID=A0ABW6KEB4_9BACI
MNATQPTYTVKVGHSYQVSGDETQIREWMYERLGYILGYYPSLESRDDDGELEVYLHTETDEELEPEQLAQLEKLGITDCNSLNAILSVCGGTLQ